MPRIGSTHWKKFEEFLLSNGCEYKRTKGDHLIYWKKGILRPLVIPKDTHIPEFIILNNLRVLGLTRETYLEFIGKK